MAAMPLPLKSPKIVQLQNCLLPYQRACFICRGTPPDVRGTTFYTLVVIFTPGTPVLSTDSNDRVSEKNIQRYLEGFKKTILSPSLLFLAVISLLVTPHSENFNFFIEFYAKKKGFELELFFFG